MMTMIRRSTSEETEALRCTTLHTTPERGKGRMLLVGTLPLPTIRETASTRFEKLGMGSKSKVLYLPLKPH